MTVHFLNLTNGLACADHAPNPHYTRIQSTALEQKRFAEVLDHAGDDLLMHLALGRHVTIHDVSERPRRTRALWQGVPWVTYALQRAWGLPLTPATIRSGEDCTRYFERHYRALTEPQRRRVQYYRKFNPTGVRIGLCDGIRPYRDSVITETIGELANA